MSRISAKTRTVAIFGHPVAHSMSPAIHNAAFEALSLDFVYVAHDVEPAELGAALAGVRAMGYRGLSITIPHKVEALRQMDQVDPVAQGIGCVNTVVVEAGRLSGYNSDGRGAIGALDRAGASPRDKRVVVLGSGGASRAITMTLAIEAPPAELVVLGAVRDEIDKLVVDLRARGLKQASGSLLDSESLAKALSSADLLLQTTPVGMHPKTSESLVERELLRPGLVVFDAVYNPRKTRLLLDAEARGCQIVEGLEMFLGQAVVQFELWTGKPAPVEVMRRVLMEQL